MSVGNLIMLLDNYVDYAVVGSSSEQPTALARFVQDYRRRRYWRSAVGTESRLTFVMPNPRPVEWLGLVDTNKVDSITFEAWDDAIDGSAKTLEQTFAPMFYTDPNVPGKPYGGIYGGPYGSPITTAMLNARNVTRYRAAEIVDSRFWAVTFSGGGNWQRCGRVFIGAARQARYNIDWGVNWRFVDRSPSEESIGGQLYTDRRPSPLEISSAFSYLSDEERDQALIDIHVFDKTRPFILSVYPDETGVRAITTTSYGHLVDPQISHNNYDINAMPFVHREDL